VQTEGSSDRSGIVDTVPEGVNCVCADGAHAPSLSLEFHLGFHQSSLNPHA